MPYTKRKLAGAGLAALTSLSLLLTGCSSSGQQEGASGDKTITVWMKKQLLDSQNKAFKERAEQFEKDTGVEVDLEVIAYEDFYAKWAAAIESGDVPDVSFFGYQEIGQFYDQGVLEPVTDLVSTIETENGAISEKLKAPVTFEGKQYAVPFWAEPQVMYYRSDLLKAAGIDSPPKTWEDYRTDTKKLTDKEKGVFGAGIGFSQKNSDSEFFARTVAWSYGGSLDAAPAEYAGVKDASAASIDVVTGIFEDGSTPSDALSWDDAGNNRSYLAGQSATVFNSGSLLATIQTQNPELYGNTEVAPFPGGSKSVASPGILNSLGIFSKADNKEDAQAFIKSLLNNQWYDKWTSDAAPLTVPVYDKLRQGGVWTEGKNVAFAESVDGATFLGSPTAYSPSAGEIYNNRLVNKMYQEVLINHVDKTQALNSLRSQIDSIYSAQK